ncbi:MAG: efflux RND transporter permease subunit [Solirubrobacterales bacterium]
MAGFCARYPWPVLGLIAALAVAGTVAALRLQTNAGTDTLVDKDNATYRATQRFKEKFGDDAVVVLVEGDLRNLVLTANLGKLLGLEGCLSGNEPAAALKTLPEACQKIAELQSSQVVFGPATFLNQSVVQIEGLLRGQIANAQKTAKHQAALAREEAAKQGLSTAEQDAAAKQAQEAVLQQFQTDLFKIASQYDIQRAPRIDDPVFVSKIVFDEGQPSGTPKPRFSYLFPNADSALISIRMQPGLSESEREDAIRLYREAVEDPQFKLDKAHYVVSGVPAVVEGLADSLRSETFILLGASVLIMAIVLGLVLAPPLRLLPLFVALAAAGITFGVLSLTGGSLTMASIAVLPVLIGLAVDYAIQLQARWAEAREAGLAPAEAAEVAAGRGGPVIGTAVLATAAGFAVLVLSPVPMVRSFGLLLVLGIVLAFAVALTGGLAALGLAARPRTRRRRAPAALRRLGERIELGRARTGLRLRETGTRALAVAITSPGRVLAAAALLAVCGWVAGSQSKVVSDIRELAPGSLPALRDVQQLQDQTGVSGELNVTVRSEDLSSPAVLNWMRSFQQRVLERHGFKGAARCEEADVCPAVSLPDLFGDSPGNQTAEQAEALLKSIPPYFSQAVISRDASGEGIGDTANIAFGIPVMPLDRQQDLIDDIRTQIDPPGLPGPPAGTDVEVAGLPALAAQANQDLSLSRYWLPLVALLAVALVLALAYRSLWRAIVPLVPIVFATGWSALVVAAMEIPLNPMSATLGALVIAIATEFSVILSARYEAERRDGLSVGEALRRTYERTGTAVLASGVTAIAGFAALTASDIQMLRDFGLVTIADLAVALAGVMLVLPAVLVWAESAREAPSESGLWARLAAPARYG